MTMQTNNEHDTGLSTAQHNFSFVAKVAYIEQIDIFEELPDQYELYAYVRLQNQANT